MKKTTIGLIVTCMVFTILIRSKSVKASEFENNEQKYITLCSSKTLTNNETTTCKEFNAYLKEKNANLKDQITQSEKSIDVSKVNLAQIEAEIIKVKSDIVTKQSEIDYLNSTIVNLEKSIADKEAQVKDSMYVMQSYTNNNIYVDFIFGASSFTDMFARIDSINEITSYDKDLVQQLADSKNELEVQRKTVVDAKAYLDSKKADQEALQQQYLAAFEKQNADLIAQQKSEMEASNASQEIDNHLAALAAAAEQSRIDNIQAAIPNTNTSTTPVVIDGQGETTPPATNGDVSVGLAIANYALSKQGSPYVWGASGPNSFDCSGLVYWAYKQADVNFKRTTAAVLSTMGTSVSYANLQPGDIITFKTIPSYVSHVGIYIGGGKMVHAPTFNQPVQVANLNTAYWQSIIYNCRRLY